MNKKIFIIIGIIIILLASFLVYHKLSNNYKNQTVKIKLGYLIASQSIPMLLASKEGYFAKEGLDVELVNLERRRGDEDPLIASGSLDCSNSSKLFTIKAISQGMPLKIVSSLAAPGGPPVFKVVVKKDSGIKTIFDLAGKTMGFAEGGYQNFLIDNLFKKNNFDITNVNYVNLKETDAIPSFRSDKINVYVADILTYQEVSKDFELVTLANSSEFLNNSYIDALVCSQQFINEHPKELAKLLKVIYEVSAFINQNPSQTKEILKNEGADPSWQNLEFPIYAETPQYAQNGIEQLISWLGEKGYLKSKVTTQDVVYSIQ